MKIERKPSLAARIGVLVPALLLAVPLAAWAGGLEAVPADYSRWLEPRLAPTPPALAAGDVMVDGKQTPNGVVLLDEEIRLAHSDGSRIRAVHRVLQPLTPRGAERLARVPHPFLSCSETVSVARARLLSPDGATTRMREDLMFVQTPEVLRGCEHYSELAELILLFPRVRPGDRVEYVVVQRADETIPGEFTAFLPIADPWPIRLARRELLLPSPLAARLKSVPVGIDGRAPQSEPVDGPDGHVAFSWRFEDRPSIALEPGRAPVRQSGPGLWLSTLSGWDDVARWYHALVSRLPSTGRGLEEAAAELASDAGDRNGVIRALHRAVARRVEYVGIEFGMARLRPRPPAEVWDSRFGDCKDQAQLLRALLAARGIESHLALVNTAHAGTIEERAPDFRQFDHVILAVPRDDGGYLFCDPTQPGLEAGELPQSCLARHALVVKGERAELIRMPDPHPESLDLRFEVDVDAYGALRGWMRIEADGHQGRMLIADLGRRDREEAIDRTTRFVGRFFPQADVVDLMRDAAAGSGLFAAYFTGRVETEWRGAKLHVPHGGIVLPEVGRGRCRETAFHQPLGTARVAVRYELPAGWAIRGTPPGDLRIDTTAARAQADWDCSGGACEGVLRFTSQRSVIPPAEFPDFRQLVRRTASWLDQPLHIGTEQGVAGSPADGAGDRGGAMEDQPPPVEMPRLPTGEGQLRLVDVQYPRDGDLGARRAALACVRRWFADDPPTALQAGLQVVVIDQVEGRIEASLREIRRLVDLYGSRAPRKLTAWAEYLRADALRELGRVREALPIYEALARARGLSAHRRGWAFLEAARLRATESTAAAVDLLDRAMELDSPALADQLSLCIDLLCRDRHTGEARAALDRAARRHPDRSVELHRRIIEDAAAKLRDGRLQRAALLAEILVPAVRSDDALASLRPRVACLGRSVARTALCEGMARRIGERLQEHPPEWWDEVELDVEALGRDRLVLVLQQLDRSEQVRRFVKGTVELVTHWQVAPDFFGFLIWRCADQLEKSGLSPELASQFRRWSESLPEGIRHSPRSSKRDKSPNERRVPS